MRYQALVVTALLTWASLAGAQQQPQLQPPVPQAPMGALLDQYLGAGRP